MRIYLDVSCLNRPFDEAKYKRLLDGLEIIELRLSEAESGIRIDAEMYQKHFDYM